MNTPAAPKDGDFASYVEGANAGKPPVPASQGEAPSEEPASQTLQQVLEGEEPTAEFLEQLQALENAPELSEEELARQALEAPGDDGDPRTPE